MDDRVLVETRSRIMSSVRSKDTKPELTVRRMLWEGLQYRTHDRTLPGTPDVSNKRRNLAVFVDSCFWHGCPCMLRRAQDQRGLPAGQDQEEPATRGEVRNDLKGMGFRVVETWEHGTTDSDMVTWKVRLFGTTPATAGAILDAAL